MRCGRIVVWSALVTGLAATVWAAEAPAATRVRPIQPGAPVCPVAGPLDDGTCSQWATLNFVFADRRGQLYIGSVAHNFGGVGDRATIRGERRSFGTVVFDDDSVDFLHPGDPASPDGTDFALVRIDRNRYRDVDPAVRGIGGPSGVSRPEETSSGQPVAAYGQGRADLQNPKGARDGQLVHDSSTGFSSTVSEAGGDSGMPYVLKHTGKALGVNATCVCGADAGYYPTVGYLLRRLADHGFHLRLVSAR